MLELTKRLDANTECEVFDSLILPYELRIRGRLKGVTEKGHDVGLFLDRGPVLRDGDLLEAKTGEVIRVHAANEPVTTAYINGTLPLARLCYHLGNRHTLLAVGQDEDGRCWVRMTPDHVLEELALLLGATLTHHQAPFDPESGAYAHVGREQSHDHSHGHHHHGRQHEH
ncbi:urease accessory protein UreE [Vibrio rotiferianus]|uniref:urease accessory protein UreE n=1 Tax=Vibrio rotiferianus TaxID=190895 RepID=UPI003909AB56